MEKTKEVFISYKSEEFEEANWVKETLENNGISCWMAPGSIKGGASYAAEIPKAIRNCKVFVLILSEQSQTSKWVPRELDQAINEGKTILPFMLENCGLKDDFNFYLTNVQRYAAYENKAAAIERMLKEIRAVLGTYDTPEVQQGMETVQVRPQAEEVKAQTKENKVQAREEKPQREKKSQGEKKPAKEKKAKNGKLALAVIAVLFVGIFLFKMTSQITIAGEKVSKNETYLYLSEVTLTAEDVEQLGKLEKLSNLMIHDCELTEGIFQQINTLDLRMLTLENCGLTDAQLAKLDFEKMSELTALNLNGNAGITNLEAAASLSDTLSELQISDTAVQNLQFLKEAQSLQTLYAANNGIEDISPLMNCADLKEVNLDGNKLTSLGDLSACTELEIVSVNGNQLSNLKGLENSIQIREILAGSNQLESLEGLENTTILEKVFLNDNHLTDIALLGKSVQTLERVYLNNNQITDIAALEECTLLTHFSADNNKLVSVESLSNANALKEVSLAGNRLTSLEGLQNCGELTYIDVSKNALTDTQVLAGLSLQSDNSLILNLSQNNIASLALPGMVNYHQLDLTGNPITDLSALPQSEIRNLAFDYAETIDYAKLAEGTIDYYFIVGCPLDQQVSVSGTLGEVYITFETAEEVAARMKNFIPTSIKGVEEYYVISE